MVNSKQAPVTVTATDMEVNKSKVSGTDGEPSQFLQSPSRLKTSTMSILTAIGTRFFSKPPEESAKSAIEKSETASIHSSQSNKSSKSYKSIKNGKSNQEVQERSVDLDEKPQTPQKDKKTVPVRKKRESQLEVKHKLERDFRRFRSKYNNSLGNIVRSWMNLIYCVLILRMNVVKLILQRIQENHAGDFELEQQIRFESKIIYNMIRQAQNYSQERFLFLWNQLEKLIVSRAVIRSALEEVHDKELVLRDWKGTASKLEQVRREVEKLKGEADAILKLKSKTDEEANDKLAELEMEEEAKDQELKHILNQISEIKRKEVKLRGKILINMKNYKDLKVKKENMMNIEKELMQLKDQQKTVTKDYTDKIQMLKMEIEEKERLINAEISERKKLKANLKGLGDQNPAGIIKDEPVT